MSLELATSNYNSYIRLLRETNVDTAYPIHRETEKYLKECLAGNIDNVAHMEKLSKLNHPEHETAALVENFFEEQVRYIEQMIGER